MRVRLLIDIELPGDTDALMDLSAAAAEQVAVIVSGPQLWGAELKGGLLMGALPVGQAG